LATVGVYSLEQAGCLEAIYRMGLRETVPLSSVDPSLANHLERMTTVLAHARLADLYQVVGEAEKAQAEDEAGLAYANTPQLRARFLFERARLAFLSSTDRRSESRRLVDGSLAVVGDLQDALWLRDVLAGAR
jgi:hypothetical protein